MEMTSANTNIKFTVDGNIWGWLVNLGDQHLEPLQGDKVTIGREGDIVITQQHLERAGDENQSYLKISRRHFEIHRNSGQPVMIVTSTNGTYVNQLKVGNFLAHRLNHGDIISLLVPSISLYSLLLEDSMGEHYPETVVSRYIIGRKIGSGSSAVVMEAYTRNGHNKRAVKRIKEDVIECGYESSSSVDVMREVDVLKGIKHPCITGIIEAIVCQKNIFIVMEFAAGGDLFDQVVKDSAAGNLKEENAKLQLFQIVHALVFLHSKKISHRDLKLENILLQEPGPTSRIKITDFGLSKKWSSLDPLATFVG